jgi:hypothetical protein
MLSCYLFILDTAATSLLGRRNSLLVLRRCGSSACQVAQQPRSRLEWSLHVAIGGLAEEVDLDLVALECALERDDRLDQEGVGVLEVQVHDSHHCNSHQLCLVQRFHLIDVVLVDSGGNELGLFGGTHLGLLDVLQGGHVCKDASALVENAWSTARVTENIIPFFLLIWRCV